MLFAQTDNLHEVFENFQTNYNEEQYGEIFNSFSSEMQDALPLQTTKQFLTNLQSQFGKITSKELVESANENSGVFRTQFERAVLDVSITIDDNKKMTSLFAKPYQEPQNFDAAQVNALSNYPTNIAERIFSTAKDLPNSSQLAIAVIQNGKTEYYGVIREDSTIKPIKNQDKVFEIGSITKVFTSTVLASLVVNEEIQLTDEINSYYPFDFKGAIKITFESLANHTSGLPRLPENLDLSNTTNPYKSYGKNEIETYLKDLLQLENKPATAYSYSNVGAGLLGYTLGVSQKTTFQELLQANVFEKYNMSNSHTSSKNLGNQLVKGMDKSGNIVANWDFDVLFGGGGIVSTAEDLVTFANAHFDPKNLELALTRKPTFEVNENMTMGLGWHILRSKKNNDLYFHNGGTGGYSSFMTINVKNKSAVIILSNVSGINAALDELGLELINEIE
jgi:CubicO group peptidase (beta-lactamase class C family)